VEKKVVMRVVGVLGVSACLCGVFAGSASAAYLNGSFGQAPIAGADGIIAFESGTTGVIDFCPENSGTPPQPGCGANGSGNTGSFDVTGATGLPAALTGAGTILDLASAAYSTFTVFPVGSPSSINNFLSIAGFDFVGTLFQPEVCTTTSTQFCIGGFQFAQAGSNVTITTVFDGTVTNTDGSGNISSWTDVLTAQYTNTTIAAVFAAATSAGGIDTNAWSGSVAVTGAAPEPGTTLLFGAGLIGLGLMGRRHLRRS